MITQNIVRNSMRRDAPDQGHDPGWLSSALVDEAVLKEHLWDRLCSQAITDKLRLTPDYLCLSGSVHPVQRTPLLLSQGTQ
ncbi:hypothetical protein J6590_046638 [Homalodisca vitripennis]|nr:hypothetical protein J6590_046638 [Homalodisca vitripennis]